MTPLKLQHCLPILVVGLGLTLASCWDLSRKNLPPPEEVTRAEAYVPVYGFDTAANAVKTMLPQPIVLAGKIYVWGNLLFQIEKLKGIHVINYADRSNPVKLGFIKVRGCSELAVKGSHLITNNLRDLVTIDISDPANAKEVSRIKEAFPHYYASIFENSLPPQSGYYICPDFTKGDVVGWTLEKNVKGAYCLQ